MADSVSVGQCWLDLGWPNSVVGWFGKIGVGVGLVWVGQTLIRFANRWHQACMAAKFGLKQAWGRRGVLCFVLVFVVF